MAQVRLLAQQARNQQERLLIRAQCFIERAGFKLQLPFEATGFNLAFGAGLPGGAVQFAQSCRWLAEQVIQLGANQCQLLAGFRGKAALRELGEQL